MKLWLAPSTGYPGSLIHCPSRIAGMTGKLKKKINQVYHSGNVVEVVLGITLIRLRKENHLFHSDQFHGHGPGQRFVSRHIFVYRRTNAQTESKVLSWKGVDFQLDYRTSVCLTMLQFLIKGRVSTKYSIRFDKAKMEKWGEMEVQRKFCRPRVILKCKSWLWI